VIGFTAAVVAGVFALAWGFWKLTRYFWLKIFYRLQGVQDVDVQTAYEQQLKHQAFLLDVREPHEYEEARIDGIPLIPVGQLAARAGELAAYKQQPVLIICRGGVRSAKACLILSSLGFAQPLNIAGGMNAWKRSQLPFVSGPLNAV